MNSKNELSQCYKEWIKAFDSVIEFLSNYDICSAKAYINLMRESYEKGYYETISKTKEELSIKDRLDTLMCAINYTLDCNNRDEFYKLSKEYNKIKLQLD